jgi:hypothetical protein
MIVRKRRGKEELMPIKVTEVQVRLAKKMGISIQEYVKAYVLLIAKKRRWKWYLERHGVK